LIKHQHLVAAQAIEAVDKALVYCKLEKWLTVFLLWLML